MLFWTQRIFYDTLDSPPLRFPIDAISALSRRPAFRSVIMLAPRQYSTSFIAYLCCCVATSAPKRVDKRVICIVFGCAVNSFTVLCKCLCCPLSFRWPREPTAECVIFYAELCQYFCLHVFLVAMRLGVLSVVGSRQRRGLSRCTPRRYVCCFSCTRGASQSFSPPC